MIDNLECLFNKAVYYEKHNDLNRAIEIYEVIISSSNDLYSNIELVSNNIIKIYAESYFRLYMLTHANDIKYARESIALYKIYLERNSKDNEATIDFIDLLNSVYEYKESWQQLLKLLKSEPDLIPALERASDLLYYYNNINTIDECMKYNSKLIELQPRNLSYYHHMAVLWKHSTDISNARSMYIKMLTIGHHDSLAREKFEAQYNENLDIFIEKSIKELENQVENCIE